MRSAADDERETLRRAALEGLAVARPLKADHRIVAVGGGSALDRDEAGVLVPQLLDDLVHLGVVDRLDLRREGVVGVGAQLDRGAYGQRHAVGRALALGEADPLGGRDLQHVEIRARLERVNDGRLEEVVPRLVVDGVRAGRVVAVDAELAFEHRPRHLAGPEAGHPRAPADVADGLVDRPLQPVGGHLHLEDHRALGGGCERDVHGPRSIRAGTRRGRTAGPAGGRTGGRGRGRTGTPLTRHRLLRPARLPFRHSPA